MLYNQIVTPFILYIIILIYAILNILIFFLEHPNFLVI